MLQAYKGGFNMKMLKKILVLIVILSFFTVGVYAADSVGISNITEEDYSVKVSFEISGLKDYEDVTILIFRKTEEKSEPDTTNIVYVNQMHTDNNEISLNLLQSAAEGVYEVRMGGDDIDNISIGTFEITSVLWGDVNCDGKITVSDAVWILRNLSGDEMAQYVTIENGNINSDNQITISDAVWILKYLSGAEIPDYVKLSK